MARNSILYLLVQVGDCNKKHVYYIYIQDKEYRLTASHVQSARTAQGTELKGHSTSQDLFLCCFCRQGEVSPYILLKIPKVIIYPAIWVETFHALRPYVNAALQQNASKCKINSVGWLSVDKKLRPASKKPWETTLYAWQG